MKNNICAVLKKPKGKRQWRSWHVFIFNTESADDVKNFMHSIHYFVDEYFLILKKELKIVKSFPDGINKKPIKNYYYTGKISGEHFVMATKVDIKRKKNKLDFHIRW